MFWPKGIAITVKITIFALNSSTPYAMTIKEYITELNRQYQTGQARESSYRPALQRLLADMLPQLTVVNEPARLDCGAPDYILTRNSDNLPVAFLEAKDINDKDLDGRNRHREQFNRYKASLEHIAFTDYLDFHFYDCGEWVDNVRIGECRGGKIIAFPEQEEKFRTLVKRLTDAAPQRIVSASRLASQMAVKARLMAEIIKTALNISIQKKAACDRTEQYSSNSQLLGQMEAFRRVLINDITPESFADIYAQTIAYGMFAARLHDPTPDTFSRQEAATLIPKTNPFLRQIFQSIAGYDLDNRIAWIVDDLAATFRVTDVAGIMEAYGKNGKHSDPMIHFYEDFLSAYDPALRKAKGVWYTPQPVVRFIVRAVDQLLQSSFSLPQGLADSSMVERETENEQQNKPRKGKKSTYKRRFHRVQLLDPATGTGTFLAEAVRQIHSKFSGMEGIWQGYVEEHLLPRLAGFELLMASYAMAHIKLDMLLGQTGYVHRSDRRLRIYLTNSLEEFHPDTGTLFSQWLSNEASEANYLKRDTPVMVLMGNPPYNGKSKNKGEWITQLMQTYKKEPGGKRPLQERNKKWLNDDYVKFIRMAQYFIEKTGEGIIAFINPHGYIDNPTFRGMRWNLLRTFDLIYTIDLHGNSNKEETCPDGSKDENVFDIKQGVSINLFVKTGKKNKNKEELGKVFHYDLYGKREAKYNFLSQTDFSDVPYKEVKPAAPMYFFVPKDFSIQEEYNTGFGINELFDMNSVGIVTTKDSFLVCDTKEIVRQRIQDIINLSNEEIRRKYDLKDTRDWTLARAKEDVGTYFKEENVQPVCYRQNDIKFLYYTGKTNGIVARPRFRSLRHLIIPANFGLVTCRQLAGNEWSHIFIANHIVDDCYISNKTKERGYIFPLYQISGEAGNIFGENELVPNFNAEVLKKIEKSLGEKANPQELFNYIYAMLHSPDYRNRYREFLKIDFPRVPYPTDKERYHRLAGKGAELRRLHLLDDVDCWTVNTTYPVDGTDEVIRERYENGRVYINDTQYFGGVPQTVWEFFIGGYQPAQKWLKDRRGRTLNYNDITHYRRIVYALSETTRVMQEIDRIRF